MRPAEPCSTALVRSATVPPPRPRDRSPATRLQPEKARGGRVLGDEPVSPASWTVTWTSRAATKWKTPLPARRCGSVRGDRQARERPDLGDALRAIGEGSDVVTRPSSTAARSQSGSPQAASSQSISHSRSPSRSRRTRTLSHFHVAVDRGSGPPTPASPPRAARPPRSRRARPRRRHPLLGSQRRKPGAGRSELRAPRVAPRAERPARGCCGAHTMESGEQPRQLHDESGELAVERRCMLMSPVRVRNAVQHEQSPGLPAPELQRPGREAGETRLGREPAVGGPLGVERPVRAGAVLLDGMLGPAVDEDHEDGVVENASRTTTWPSHAATGSTQARAFTSVASTRAGAAGTRVASMSRLLLLPASVTASSAA